MNKPIKLYPTTCIVLEEEKIVPGYFLAVPRLLSSFKKIKCESFAKFYCVASKTTAIPS